MDLATTTAAACVTSSTHHDPADHVRGTSSATVTLLEYCDFECPHCRQSERTVQMLMLRFGERMRFVFRHFPLTEIHPFAELAAEASEAAAAQGQFWLFHDNLFRTAAGISRAQLLVIAEQIGLDIDRFARDLEARTHLQRVRDHLASGARAGVRAAPTFFLNGRLVDVSYGVQRLEQEIDRLLGGPPAWQGGGI